MIRKYWTFTGMGTLEYGAKILEQTSDMSEDERILKLYHDLTKENRSNIQFAMMQIGYIQSIDVPKKVVDKTIKLAKDAKESENAVCSFCGKPVKDVERMIAGPEQLYICNECLTICYDIINEDGEDSGGE